MEHEHVKRKEVLATGRRMDAEVVRAMLEARGLDVTIWSSGMGPWRMESAVSEITGVPSSFAGYRVMVIEEQFEEAHDAIADADLTDPDEGSDPEYFYPGYDWRWMEKLRSRAVLVATSIFLLVLVLLVGTRG